jgi:F-type H+-transporting ATPase subunit gamma
MKNFVATVRSDVEAGVGVSVIAIGRKIARLASRMDDVDLVAAYESFPERPTESDILPILSTALEMFESRKVDKVDIVYTDFKSSITQEVVVETVLPAVVMDIEDREDLNEADFEPSPRAVLESVTPRLIAVQLLQALLESFASEHSMRMMAMKNASDNAGDIIDDLTLEFNSARQAAITQELAEITGGAEAIA